jgi:hypothetical protein
METLRNSAAKNLNPSMSSVADSLAKISAKPESERDSMEIAAGFGLSTPVSLGFFDPDTFSLRTFQGSLLCEEQWAEFLEIFPDSGMWDAGGVYELLTSEHPISESACLSSQNWPTVVGSQTRASTRKDGTGGKILSEEAANWPTARREDGESCGNHPGATDSLTGAVKTWPTPRTLSGGGESAERKQELGRTLSGGGDLQAVSEHWRTPCSRDEHPNLHNPNRKDSQLQLAHQTERWKMFPTPAARDYRTPNSKTLEQRGGGKKGEQLQSFVEHSLQAPATPDGKQSSEIAQTSRRRLVAGLTRALLSF